MRAARTLADIGTDLADAGESLTEAVDPDALQVVGGRLPIEEVTKITPQLEHGAAVLAHARARLDHLRDDPYLVAQVRDAVDKVYGQLARADREAQHAAAAARLAPAIFGADGDRNYLLVVQNNAESRATGGFIGSYALDHRPRREADRGRHHPDQDVGRHDRASRRRSPIGRRSTTRGGTRSTARRRRCRT